LTRSWCHRVTGAEGNVTPLSYYLGQPVTPTRGEGAGVHTEVTVGILDKLVLTAHGWPEFGGEFDLLDDHLPHLPERSGVYIVLSQEGEPHRYPFGTSSVIYIGRASGLRGLRKRLSDHRTQARACRLGAEGRLYDPLYEWINSAGGIALYSAAPGNDVNAKRMETLLLNAFSSMHYALPIANGMNGVQHIDEKNWVL
jgi:hypothetical protein